MPSDSPTPGLLPKVLSAVSYGFSTGILLFANKLLLTNFQFPSFLWVAISQMITIVVILFLAKRIGLLSFPDIDMSIPRKIFPLPLFFVVNLVSGLGGTQKISLPMFTVLTRLSIFLTMVLEFFILGVNPSLPVKISVFLMIFGAFVAAM
ncbi:hypothetical protein FO519_010186 [Halicephalobus sp. NKZ332]|nr:hypothetical protein FO519_010186 [Halicephalobus sp. NKZ332]